jgi:predicted O-methyltransferase YrrM
MAGMLKLHNSKRKIYCFDTFSGMTAMSPKDTEMTKEGQKLVISRASLNDVKNNFQKCGLLDDNIIFVEGDVLQTLDNEASLPGKIAVLRLDTDYYLSTKKELEVLYPRLIPNGVLIVDDYGGFIGSQRAVDEYFTVHGKRSFFSYVDRNARVGVKI